MTRLQNERRKRERGLVVLDTHTEAIHFCCLKHTRQSNFSKFKFKKLGTSSLQLNSLSLSTMTLNSSSVSGSSSASPNNDSEIADLETSTTSQVDHSSGTTDHSGKRLIIQKMVLKNFKSYAGKREIGPFDKVSISGRI